MTYHWACPDEGVWPLNDLADVRGTEEGGNVHGLFGALVVGDPGTTYHDPETGCELHGEERAAVGLYVDIHVPGEPGDGRTEAGTSTCTCTACAATASSRSSSTTSRRCTAGCTSSASTP